MADPKLPQGPNMDEEIQSMGADEEGGELPERVSASEEHGQEEVNPLSFRRPLGEVRRLDADYYAAKYHNKKLAWVNDLDGDVERWIDAGAEPVPTENKSGRVFEGITDRATSQWVRAVAGTNGNGEVMYAYLLMMDPDVYDAEKLAPIRARQEAIEEALRGGKDQSGGEGGELKTYAPHLPTGGKGYEVLER